MDEELSFNAQQNLTGAVLEYSQKPIPLLRAILTLQTLWLSRVRARTSRDQRSAVAVTCRGVEELVSAYRDKLATMVLDEGSEAMDSDLNILNQRIQLLIASTLDLVKRLALGGYRLCHLRV